METRERPTFLTVICILSFIAIGLGLLGQLFNFAFSPNPEEFIEAQEQMEDLMAESEDNPFGSFFSSIMSQSMGAIEHAKTLGIVNILGLILCLFGVIKMWNLKKVGFVPYIIGNLASPIASVVLVGLLGGIAVFSFFFPILFIVLYGLNLKHMS